MTAARRAAELFVELAEKAPEERASAMAELAAADPDLARVVGELLAADAAVPPSFLAALDPSTELLRQVLETTDASESGGGLAPGARVGPYRLVSLLGQGGMGEVWRAERADGQFEQTVALKVVKRGMDSSEILLRFRRERQILARLDHPGIARLLDGGIAEDGRPYFAMELVEGESITQRAIAGKLPVNDRVRLLHRCCEAVAAAHARLVIHRDLKPSNMLVTSGGGIKLLDFGIAKLLAGDDAGDPGSEDLTRLHLPMTPAYASPEQILGDPVRTATDVYSLGAVLYELLTEKPPFHRRATNVPGLRDEIAREVFVRPSRAEASSSISLARQEAADLDTIVAKALHADPARRYGSVEGFAADLERFLDGRPVLARPDSAGYRLAKLVRRNRFAFAAASLAFGALAVGLGVAVFQRERAREAARHAASEAAHARQVQELMVQLFEGADPTRTLGASLSARQVLDEGARRLDRDSTVEPEIRADLSGSIARTYRALGLLDEARLHARAALDLHRGNGDAGTLKFALAELTAAEVDVDRGDLEPARAVLERVLPRFESELGLDSAEAQRARAALGTALAVLGDEQRSLELLRANVDSARRTHGDDSLETAMAQGALASTEGNLSHYEAAEALQREALARLARIGGAKSPQAIRIEGELAEVLSSLDRNAESEEHFRIALANAREVLGPRHPETGQVLIRYGFLAGTMLRMRESDAMLEEAAEIFRAHGHFDYGAAVRYLGYNSMRQERFAEARVRFAEAERFFRETLGGDDPMTWAAVVSRALAEMKVGRLIEAEPAQREAIAALTRIHGAESDPVRAPMKHLGENLRRQGRIAEALLLHQQTLAIESKIFGDKPTLATATTHAQLAEDLLATGAASGTTGARREIAEALAYFEKIDDAPHLGRALETSARIALAEGDRRRARRDLERAVALLTNSLDAAAPSLAQAKRELARLAD